MALALTTSNTIQLISSPTSRGLPTIFLGVLSYFLLADDPASARFLTPAEKLHTEERMSREMGLTKKDMEFHCAYILISVSDPQAVLIPFQSLISQYIRI